MSPRNTLPDDDDELLGKRELQRINKQRSRRAHGMPDPSAVSVTISRALWIHRERHGLTQQQLGELLHMKQSQIARLESGFVEPSLETLVKLSGCLGLDFRIEVKSGAIEVAATHPGI